VTLKAHEPTDTAKRLPITFYLDFLYLISSVRLLYPEHTKLCNFIRNFTDYEPQYTFSGTSKVK